MADNTPGSDNSATTVLIAVIIILLIGAAFYFGVMRSNGGEDNVPTIDINATVPAGTEGGGIAE